MTDYTNERETVDYGRISLEQNYEIRYWTTTFNCTVRELRQAVAKVGTSTEAVRKKLMR